MYPSLSLLCIQSYQDVRVARMGNPQLIMQIHDELIYEVTAQPSHGNKNHSDDFRCLCVCVCVCVFALACTCAYVLEFRSFVCTLG